MRLFEGTIFDRPPRCEVCDELEEDCKCPPPAEVRTPTTRQTARIGYEKRKKGKFVTVIRDLLDEGEHLPELLTLLKSHCGTGGTLKDGEIELQGDQRERIRQKLQSLGYRVKG